MKIGQISAQTYKAESLPKHQIRQETVVDSLRVKPKEFETDLTKIEKKVEPKHFGSLEDYLRFEEGVVNAIDNIKIYIETINQDHIKESEIEMDKIVSDYIKKAVRMSEFRKEAFMEQKFNGKVENLQKMFVEDLKNELSDFARLKTSYATIIEKLRDRQDKKQMREIQHSKEKVEESILKLLDEKRETEINVSKQFNAHVFEKNEFLWEVSDKTAEKVTEGFKSSQKKFNNDHFEKLLFEKIKEIDLNYEKAKKAKASIDSGKIKEAIKIVDSLKLKEELNLTLKKQFEMECFEQYTSSGAISPMKQSDPIFEMLA